MHRQVTAALLLFALANHANADIIYNIQPYPSDQNGYTLSGTITTDGVMGALSASDILAWQYTATNGLITYSASSTDTGASISATGLEAEGNQLLLPYGNGGTYSLTFSDPNGQALPGGTTNLVLEWLLHVGSEVSFYQYELQVNSGPPAWSTGSTPTSSSFIIAQEAPSVTTPEPASITLMLAGFGALMGSSFVRRRRRAAGRRNPSPQAHL
jgi:hypothetical protein